MEKQFANKATIVYKVHAQLVLLIAHDQGNFDCIIVRSKITIMHSYGHSVEIAYWILVSLILIGTNESDS